MHRALGTQHEEFAQVWVLGRLSEENDEIGTYSTFPW